jgi:hypothetical protein
MSRRPTTQQRSVCVLLIAALGLTGCSTTVKEHDADGVAPSVTVKAYWEHDGEKYLVAGLFCQLVSQAGGEPELIAQGETSAEQPLVFTDLEPGRYRLIVRGVEVNKVAEEFVVPRSRRVTVRIDVDALETEREVAEVAGAVGEGALYVMAGAVIVPIAVIGLVLIVGLLASADDDDDDCDDEMATEPDHSQPGRSPDPGPREGW